MKPAHLLCLFGFLCAFVPALLAAPPGPEKFEPYLREHPDDELQREAAIQWYAWNTHDLERLRYHTLEMVERHPSNMQIYFKNGTEFLAKPDYHAEVLHRLEERVKTKPSHGAYWMLALICQRRAVPPDFSTEAKKRRFLSYNLLESEAGLPKQVDPILVDKTIEYFKKAGALAIEDESRHHNDALWPRTRGGTRISTPGSSWIFTPSSSGTPKLSSFARRWPGEKRICRTRNSC